MQSLILVPTFVSENIDEKLIPFICKLIERNIGINYRGRFQKALDKLAMDYEQEMVEAGVLYGHKPGSREVEVDETIWLRGVGESNIDELIDMQISNLLHEQFLGEESILNEAKLHSLKTFSSRGGLRFVPLKAGKGGKSGGGQSQRQSQKSQGKTQASSQTGVTTGTSGAPAAGGQSQSQSQKSQGKTQASSQTGVTTGTSGAPAAGGQSQSQSQKSQGKTQASSQTGVTTGTSGAPAAGGQSQQSQGGGKSQSRKQRRAGGMSQEDWDEYYEMPWSQAAKKKREQREQARAKIYGSRYAKARREEEELEAEIAKFMKEEEELKNASGSDVKKQLREKWKKRQELNKKLKELKKRRPLPDPGRLVQVADQPTREKEITSSAKLRSDLEKPEVPKGVIFYDTINLEPTMFEFYFRYKSPRMIGNYLQKDSHGRPMYEIRERLFIINIKCVVFKLRNIPEIVSFMSSVVRMRGLLGLVQRSFYQIYREIAKRIVGTRGYKIRKDNLPDDPGARPYVDIIYLPDYWELDNPKFLAKKLNPSIRSWLWASLMILSKEDFNEDFNYTKFFNSYKKLASIGWGDIVVIDKVSEIFHYCSLSLLHCTKIPLAYLKQLLNVNNVIDFTELSRYSSEAKPFSFGGLSLMPGVSIKTKGKEPFGTFFKRLEKEKKNE